MRVCVLASGSGGNSIFVASEKTRILVDVGLSGKETENRLQAAGSSLEEIDAICLTHEHSDHTSGLGVIWRKGKIPVYANAGTIDALEATGKVSGVGWQVFATGSPFEVGDLRVNPFSVPHDAYEPVGFTISGEGAEPGPADVGIVTDMGMATGLVRQRLKGCRVLVIEANHDDDLLKGSSRPWSLKQRIAGRQGHFSNAQVVDLMAEVAGPALRTVFLAHLSSECNSPELASRIIRAGLASHGFPEVVVALSYAGRISEVAEC